MRATHQALIVHGTAVPYRAMVLHSCNNPPCVNPAHLRVGSALDNADDMRRSGRILRGENSPASKLRTHHVIGIRWLYASTLALARKDHRRFTITKLAHLYGVSNQLISAVINRKVWEHVG